MKLLFKERSSWSKDDLFRITIEGDIATFWGNHNYTKLFSEFMRIGEEPLKELEGALDFLDVYNWQEFYSPSDIGILILDGGLWSLELSDDGRSVSSSGSNAYPSYKSVETTTLKPERYSLLRDFVFTALNSSNRFRWSFRQKVRANNVIIRHRTSPSKQYMYDSWNCPYCNSVASYKTEKPTLCDSRTCACGAIGLATPAVDSDLLAHDVNVLFNIKDDEDPINYRTILRDCLQNEGIECRSGDRIAVGESICAEYISFWFRLSDKGKTFIDFPHET